MLCGPTPLRDFYLPTIYPAAYIDLVEHGETEESNDPAAT